MRPDVYSFHLNSTHRVEMTTDLPLLNRLSTVYTWFCDPSCCYLYHIDGEQDIESGRKREKVEKLNKKKKPSHKTITCACTVWGLLLSK